MNKDSYTITISEPDGIKYTAWGTFYPGQGFDGYGSKIVTDKLIQFSDSERKYRLYAQTHSNVVSHYVIHNKKKVYLNI